MELAERESLEHVSAGASGPIDLQIAAQDRRAARTACYEYDPSSVYSDTYGIHLRRTSSAPGIYRKCNPESARLLSLPLPLGVRLFIGVLAITSIALIAAAIVYVLFAGRQQTLLWHSAHAGPLIAPITAAASPVEKTQTLAVAVDLAPSPQSVYALTRLMLLTHLPVAGTAATLLELEEISHADPQVAEVCHALAHDLGHAALTSAHVEISQVLGDRDDVCGGRIYSWGGGAETRRLQKPSA